MSTPIMVKDQDFEVRVLEAEKPVLVAFWAPWCGPCKMIAPFLEIVAEEFADDLVVAKMNIEEENEIPAQLQVRSVPHLFVFKKGDIVTEISGAPDPKKLVDLLEAVIQG